MKRNRQRLLEESKEAAIPTQAEEEELNEYPEECKIIDIMRNKYYDVISFYYDTDDKKQIMLAVKEYQRFSFFYEKMSKHLEFDPTYIEDEVYQRLDEETK